MTKIEFEIIEGKFHDGLGTYAEVSLANELISLSKISQPFFDISPSRSKMMSAIDSLPELHLSRSILQKEIANIGKAAQQGANEILAKVEGQLQNIKHVAKDYADARACY